MNSPIVVNQLLSEDIRQAMVPAFAAVAILRGAAALLENAEVLPDPDGVVWSARELVDQAIDKVTEVYMGAEENSLAARAMALEEIARRTEGNPAHAL